jgi:hypothetical protein
MTEHQRECNLQHSRYEHIAASFVLAGEMIALIVNDNNAVRAASDFTFRRDIRLST